MNKEQTAQSWLAYLPLITTILTGLVTFCGIFYQIRAKERQEAAEKFRQYYIEKGIEHLTVYLYRLLANAKHLRLGIIPDEIPEVPVEAVLRSSIVISNPRLGPLIDMARTNLIFHQRILLHGKVESASHLDKLLSEVDELAKGDQRRLLLLQTLKETEESFREPLKDLEQLDELIEEGNLLHSHLDPLKEKIHEAFSEVKLSTEQAHTLLFNLVTVLDAITAAIHVMQSGGYHDLIEVRQHPEIKDYGKSITKIWDEWGDTLTANRSKIKTTANE